MIDLADMIIALPLAAQLLLAASWIYSMVKITDKLA